MNGNNDDKKLGFSKIDIDEYIKKNQDNINKDVLEKEANTDLKEVVEYSENAQHSKGNEDDLVLEAIDSNTDPVDDEKASQTEESANGDKEETAPAAREQGKLNKIKTKIKAFIKKSEEKCDICRDFLYKKLRKVLDHPLRSSLIMAFIMQIFIETLSRKSLIGAFGFLFKHPDRFFFNFLIVLAPFMISIAVKRKLLVYIVSVILWAVVGITDYYLLTFRTTPFVGVDIDMDIDDLIVAYKYLSPVQGILITLGLLLAVGVIILFVFISPKSKLLFGRVKSTLALVGYWVATYALICIAIATGIMTTKFGNLAISYHDYGIAYCLTLTIVDTGIPEPDNYSESEVKDAIKGDDKEDESTPTKPPVEEKKQPNFIFIQLESFIDPYAIEGLECSKDPIPYFRSLMNEFSTGYITVPTIVAGTCNTEFEVISGMSLEYFGPGEYPYKTILKESVCESMASDLKNIGYTAHAIHNNKATFYGRNTVFANFGFDTFTSIETMCDVSKTPNDWAKDDVLVKSILDCLKYSEGKDVIYTVSVQCHGTYNVAPEDYEDYIKVSGIEDEELANSYTYYVNQLAEEDQFIRDLTSALSKYDEDIVLVMYGDHIPGLSISDDQFVDENRTIYDTQYVIWDNMGLEKVDKDLMAYQMAAYTFDMFDIHEGTIFKYHQDNWDDEEGTYKSKLHLLMYDMLYGEKYVYNGEKPFDKTDILYGVNEVVINKVTYDANEVIVNPEDSEGKEDDEDSIIDDIINDSDSFLYIEGENFNEFSNVFIDGEEYDAELISSTLLKVEIDEDLISGTEIHIEQINSAGKTLRKSEVFIYE